jgi:polyisoprenoid-binding protein YceI
MMKNCKTALRRAKYLALRGSLILAGTICSLAQQPIPDKVHLHLDPAATEIHFTLKDTLHTVHGTFHLKSGDLTIDTHSGTAQGMISVDTDSGASGNDTRDGKMKRDYLETTKFPLATFEPQAVTGFNPAADTQKITVAGTFTLHGSAHPMTLDFDVSHSGAQITTTTHFSIPYVAWGIRNPSIAFVRVEKEVTMEVIAKGSLNPEK